MKTLRFLAGVAAGYVLGTRAGRERYQQLVDGVRSLGNKPSVQRAQSNLKRVAGKDIDAENSTTDTTRNTPATKPGTTSRAAERNTAITKPTPHQTPPPLATSTPSIPDRDH